MQRFLHFEITDARGSFQIRKSLNASMENLKKDSETSSFGNCPWHLQSQKENSMCCCSACLVSVKVALPINCTAASLGMWEQSICF